MRDNLPDCRRNRRHHTRNAGNHGSGRIIHRGRTASFGRKGVMPLAATATTGRKTAGALFRVFFITTPLSLDFFKYIDYRMDAQPHKKRDAAKQETNAYKLRNQIRNILYPHLSTSETSPCPPQEMAENGRAEAANQNSKENHAHNRKIHAGFHEIPAF